MQTFIKAGANIYFITSSSAAVPEHVHVIFIIRTSNLFFNCVVSIRQLYIYIYLYMCVSMCISEFYFLIVAEAFQNIHCAKEVGIGADKDENLWFAMFN